jgi:F-type H+-transporting ATPase subunit delta
MPGALAVHYAEALAESVFRPDSGLTPPDALSQLHMAETVLSGSKPLEHALNSPGVSKARRRAVVEKLASQMAFHRLLRNFLVVVVSHRRTHQLPAIRRAFEAAVDQRLGFAPAQIASAKELSADQKQQIEQALSAKLGKSLRAAYVVDPALLGGVRARVASREYDASVKGKLESMRERLAFRH